MRKPSLFFIFLSVFIDLIGFGIVLPMLPIYSEQFGASDWFIGIIIASYSAMQFLFSDAWGKLSDRIGRRPVLLISNAGSTISYAMFAWASTLTGPNGIWMLLASRVFAGICGANLSVASAYIADISVREKRSQGMGLIGMAFGLGFIFGPAFGQFAKTLFGLPGPGWVAAGFCGANFILGWFILIESRRPSTSPAASRPKVEQWVHTLRQPELGWLILIYFFGTFCFTCFESTFPRLLTRRFPNAEHYLGYLFTFCGVVSAVIQGGFIGRLVRTFGEQKLIAFSLGLVAVSLVVMPLVREMGWLLLGLGLFATGSGLNRPPIFGLISLNSPSEEQGATLGVAQSAGSLARVFGPVFANSLFKFSPTTPYLVCAAIALAAGVMAWLYLCREKPLVPSSQLSKVS